MAMNSIIIQGVELFKNMQEQINIEDMPSEFVSEMKKLIADLDDDMPCSTTSTKIKPHKAEPEFSTYIIDQSCANEITMVMHDAIERYLLLSL